MLDKGPLYHFLPDETTPPPEVWNRIGKALDDSDMWGTELSANEVHLNNQEEKLPIGQTGSEMTSITALAAMEAEPPTSVWQHIQQELDRPVLLHAKPAKNNIRSIWAAAVAAACIGAIVFIAPLLKNRREAKTISSHIGTKLLQKPGKADSIIKGFLANPKTSDSLNKLSTPFPPATTNFVQAIGLNGNRVKVSPKLIPMIEFFSEGSQGKSSSPKNKWEQKLNDWRAGINAPGTNAAAINFADPIDLLRFLQTKN